MIAILLEFVLTFVLIVPRLSMLLAALVETAARVVYYEVMLAL